jgi:nucleotide-binding universal stress UspA family protein
MYRSILVPVDLNAESSWRKALPTAIRMARDYGAVLHVANVVPSLGSGLVANYLPADFERKALQAAEEHLEDFAKEHLPEDVKTEIHLAHGTIYKEIERLAREQECDLIVMASHRPEITDLLLGPNAERVVRHVSCSVLVVRD